MDWEKGNYQWLCPRLCTPFKAGVSHISKGLTVPDMKTPSGTESISLFILLSLLFFCGLISINPYILS